jgi:AraC-like DNA-binding protein
VCYITYNVIGAFEQPTYSAHLVLPFLQVLAPGVSLTHEQYAAMGLRDPDGRVPVAVAHEMLEAAVALTKDQTLGLKAARMLAFGDCGAIDYMLRSATNVRSACELATRYLRLINDAIDCQLDLQTDRVLWRMESRLSLPPVAEDFLVAGLYRSHLREWLGTIPDLECWFTHDAPADLSEYVITFGATRCRFAAPCRGFSFPSACLDVPLSNADPKLHGVIRSLAEIKLAELPELQTFTQRLRFVLERELLEGKLSCERIARVMHMSPRTLARKLEAEGTTFYELVDTVRKAAALSHVVRADVALSELSFSLGFSHVASFHRAFKRWTGQTPADYRRNAGAAMKAQSA